MHKIVGQTETGVIVGTRERCVLVAFVSGAVSEITSLDKITRFIDVFTPNITHERQWAVAKAAPVLDARP